MADNIQDKLNALGTAIDSCYISDYISDSPPNPLVYAMSGNSTSMKTLHSALSTLLQTPNFVYEDISLDGNTISVTPRPETPLYTCLQNAWERQEIILETLEECTVKQIRTQGSNIPAYTIECNDEQYLTDIKAAIKKKGGTISQVSNILKVEITDDNIGLQNFMAVAFDRQQDSPHIGPTT